MFWMNKSLLNLLHRCVCVCIFRHRKLFLFVFVKIMSLNMQIPVKTQKFSSFMVVSFLKQKIHFVFGSWKSFMTFSA